MATDEDQAGSRRYNIVQVDCGRGDFSVTIIGNCKRIVVDFLPSESRDGTPERALIERYEASFDEDEDETDAVQQELVNMIWDVGGPIFDQLAPPVATGAPLQNLHSLLFPETHHFCFARTNGKAELLEQEFDNQDYSPPPVKIDNALGLPKYSSKDIQVLKQIVGEGNVTQVLVNGQEMCCKSGHDSFDWPSVKRELDCLQKIAHSKYASTIRAPKLLGLVTSADNGQIIGILEEYLPTDLEKLPTLGEVDISVVADSRRKKWASQIREMVDLLHEIGVVWGDGKPHNVLVHRDTDDAWLIDFGGGWTDGWVDEELIETLEGDTQAVKKIFEFLKV
ncbi:hypothetical protein SS1G_08047 [Sclerotinia sclerotiorum 1980 UF-70]|uniref:Protein kinase domain-containing protein n=2 Tax=Sclerotinia sclerotiorum (strain ATCC 18683 / 1980 / Ss-1) TaxID=665079 RepID=A7ERU3_SCLS1|nr:hypothetical protein SS1G_08047 [Sclerotinia sclerotiorum 1980 UF-70]APA13366.1 hypothetical protein sscle_11g081360 [Sclerotinia sclerotiorum 1980 UF-70]EDN92185.1 hypothetical protein SS1G_08047 [Sclerotinia sclerotiorum 1980 UF-70]